MKHLQNPIINKSEIARILGISSAGVTQKMNETNGNRFTESDQQKLAEFWRNFYREIMNEIDNLNLK